MKPIEGFKAERMNNAFAPLPVGQYIAKITGVREEITPNYDNLILRLDIIEGEYAEYFSKKFKAQSEAQNSQFEVKYKGVFRITEPNDKKQKEKQYRGTKARFEDIIAKIQESNPDYTWDWDEKKLVGKLIGINVRESYFNGNKFTEIGQLESVDDVRNGKCKVLPPRGNMEEQEASSTGSDFTAVDDVEIPF